MTTLVFTIIEAPSVGWSAARTIAGFVAAIVLVAAFIAQESREEHPMLDVGLFKNLRFTAASGSVTVAFFTLFGCIFLMTQFFQFVKGYGPLSTGLRLLPVALSVGTGSIVGTQLAVKFGTKQVVSVGLLAITGFYVWVALTIAVDLSYTQIALQMVLYGLGMGLTSAPATESIMGAVSAKQAGVGSAVNDATRLLGGTLGVAIIGSVSASVYSSRLDSNLPAAVPQQLSDAAHQSIGAATIAAQRLSESGPPALASAFGKITSQAFVDAVSVGCLVAGGVALAGVLLALAFLPAQPLVLEADLPVDTEENRPLEPLTA
jgi:hypothetical protein